MIPTHRWYKKASLAPVSAAILLWGSMGWSAQSADPEWPCIQQLVAEVSPAVMWPLPVDEQMQSDWSDDDRVRPLAEQLGDLPAFTDKERDSISAFVDAVPESELEYQLSLLAAGTVEVTNRIRRNYISGIKRYTRQQIAISQQIEDALNQLSLLEDDTSADSQEKADTIKETLLWHERVYDQRERSIRLLCEQPVELEQRLSEVLRDAAQYLP